MAPVLSFFLGLGTMLALSFAILHFVRIPLRKLLVELCGTDDRAAFWQHLYEIGLPLTVVFFMLMSPPPEGAEVGFLGFVGMFRAGVSALLVTLGLLAAVMIVTIRRFEDRARPVRERRPLPPPPLA